MSSEALAPGTAARETLSVLVPAYNEAPTITRILSVLIGVRLIGGLDMEVVVVDDGSKDATCVEVEKFIAEHPGPRVRLVKHGVNRGKGAAIRTAIEQASGDYLIVQDADLEYDPREFDMLLRPILEGHADVVFGSRFLGGGAHRVLFFWHSIGNRFLTFCSNLCTNLNLTDMETCYKLFRAKILKGIKLREDRFGFEPEVTAKVSRLGVRIYEVGISYYGRTYAEGKKIGWRDGVRAIYCILKYGLLRR